MTIWGGGMESKGNLVNFETPRKKTTKQFFWKSGLSEIPFIFPKTIFPIFIALKTVTRWMETMEEAPQVSLSLMISKDDVRTW